MSTSDGARPLRLVVLGDSTSFTDEHGPQLPSAAHLYPNVVARDLGGATRRPVEAVVLARAGWTVRDTWTLVTKDRHAQFDVLAGADAVVVGVGSFDHAPAGTPAWLDAVVPFVRPAALRRRLRVELLRAYPTAVRLTAGRRRRTPPAEFDRLFDLVLQQVAGLARGAAGVVLGPTSHRSDRYAQRHPRHVEDRRRHARLAAARGYPTVQSWPLVAPHAERLNPDGVHWPATAHADVGHALAAVLVDQLHGRAARPHDPWTDLDA